MSSSLFSEQSKKPSQNNLDQNKINAILNLVRGRDPKQVFYEECQKRGVSPDSILSSIK